MGGYKMAIDVTNWLNTATNLPQVWEQLIKEVLTNRTGEFTYTYNDSITCKKEDDDDEPIYTKDYSIDLKINIDTKYGTEEDLNEYLGLSEEQRKKLENTQEALELLADFFMDNDLDMEAIVGKLKVMDRLIIE